MLIRLLVLVQRGYMRWLRLFRLVMSLRWLRMSEQLKFLQGGKSEFLGHK